MSRLFQPIELEQECKVILTKMKIKANKFEIIGRNLYFQHEEVSIVCKIGDKILFDFVEFNSELEAIEFLLKQREYKQIIIKRTERKRTEELCIRTLFSSNGF